MTSWHDADAPVAVVFGAPGRQLFGVLHPTVGAPTGPGIVIATSIVNEAVVSHRALRLLARTLAHAGMPALLYDPPASGDSFGSDDEPGRFAAWRESIALASGELAARTGARDVAVVGVRLGATLAVAAVDAGLDPAALVLWDPLSTGEDWLREERTYHLLARQISADRTGPPPSDGGEELAGFLLSGEGVVELRSIDLLSSAKVTPWRAGLPVLIIEGARRRRRPLAEPLTERGATVESQKLPGLAEMLEEAEQAAPPLEAITAITDWLRGLELDRADTSSPSAGPETILCDAGAREVAFLVDGEAGRLFGIACEPDAPPRRSPWVVILNAGFVRHIGPNRLYVRWARAWARRGLPSLRVDGRSVGESDGSDGPHQSVRELYTAGAVADAATLVAALRERRDVDGLTLVGLCSGAYMAFHVALQAEGVRRIVLLNPQILSYDEDESQRGRALYVRRSAISPAKWRSMLARRSAARQLGERTVLLARTAAAAAARQLRRRSPENEGDWLVRALTTLRDRGTEVHFVMSEGDPGLAYLSRHLGPDLGAAPSGSFELHLVRDADHTFRPLDAQRRLTPLVDTLVLGG